MIDSAVITICTKSHIPNALATMESIKRNSSINIDFLIIITDIFENLEINDCQIYAANSFTDYYKIISDKYGINSNETRWTLKPYCLMRALKIYKKVIYIDPDIYFVNDIKKIYDEITGILLTPHFRTIFNDDGDLNTLLFTHGYFNAGFIGCLKDNCCLDCLSLWGKSCLARCEKNLDMGIHDDQKYLELMFIEFDCVRKTKNKGMNIGGWNIYDIDFENIDPIFFHFSPSSDNLDHLDYQKNNNEYKILINHFQNFSNLFFQN